MGRHQQFLKIVACAVILCLLTQDAAIALSSQAAEPSIGNKEQAPVYAVSEKHGTIDEVFQGSNGKHIVFILDAHDSLDAQKNIVRLIEQAVYQSGARTVFEEGYEGALNTDAWFGAIKDSAVRKKVSYYFLDQLKVGAAEFAHINRKKDNRPKTTDQRQNTNDEQRATNNEPRVASAGEDWHLVGADDRQAYLENVRAFGDSEKVRDRILRDTQGIQSELEALSQKIFSDEAHKWALDYQRFHANSLSLIDYLTRWMPSLEPDQTPLLRRILSAAQNLEIARSIQKTRPAEVLEELEVFEKALEERHFKDLSELEIWQAMKMMSAVEKLAELKISNRELTALQASLQNLDTEKLAGQFARMKNNPVVLSSRWESLIYSALKFYDLAHKRDLAVERALLAWSKQARYSPLITRDSQQTRNEQKVASSNQDRFAILVFGGFHREGITEILRRHGFSYTVVIPKIAEFSDRHQTLYREAMSFGSRGPGIGSRAVVQAARPLSGFFEPSFGDEINQVASWAKRHDGNLESFALFAARADSEERPRPAVASDARRPFLKEAGRSEMQNTASGNRDPGAVSPQAPDHRSHSAQALMQRATNPHSPSTIHHSRVNGARSESRDKEKLSIRSIFYEEHLLWIVGWLMILSTAHMKLVSIRRATIGLPDYWSPLNWIPDFSFPLMLSSMGVAWILIASKLVTLKEKAIQMGVRVWLLLSAATVFTVEIFGPYFFKKGDVGAVFDWADIAAISAATIVAQFLHQTKLPQISSARSETRRHSEPVKPVLNATGKETQSATPLHLRVSDPDSYWAWKEWESFGYFEDQDYVLLRRKIDPLLPQKGDILDLAAGAKTVYSKAHRRIFGIGLGHQSLASNLAFEGGGFEVHNLNLEPDLNLTQGINSERRFDAAVSSFGVMYLSRPWEVFRSALAHLKPGGKLIVAYASNLWDASAATEEWNLASDHEALLNNWVNLAGGETQRIYRFYGEERKGFFESIKPEFVVFEISKRSEMRAGADPNLRDHSELLKKYEVMEKEALLSELDRDKQSGVLSPRLAGLMLVDAAKGRTNTDFARFLNEWLYHQIRFSVTAQTWKQFFEQQEKAPASAVAENVSILNQRIHSHPSMALVKTEKDLAAYFQNEGLHGFLIHEDEIFSLESMLSMITSGLHRPDRVDVVFLAQHKAPAEMAARFIRNFLQNHPDEIEAGMSGAAHFVDELWRRSGESGRRSEARTHFKALWKKISTVEGQMQTALGLLKKIAESRKARGLSVPEKLAEILEHSEKIGTGPHAHLNNTVALLRILGVHGALKLAPGLGTVGAVGLATMALGGTWIYAGLFLFMFQGILRATATAWFIKGTQLPAKAGLVLLSLMPFSGLFAIPVYMLVLKDQRELGFALLEFFWNKILNKAIIPPLMLLGQGLFWAVKWAAIIGISTIAMIAATIFFAAAKYVEWRDSGKVFFQKTTEFLSAAAALTALALSVFYFGIFSFATMMVFAVAAAGFGVFSISLRARDGINFFRKKTFQAGKNLAEKKPDASDSKRSESREPVFSQKGIDLAVKEVILKKYRQGARQKELLRAWEGFKRSGFRRLVAEGNLNEIIRAIHRHRHVVQEGDQTLFDMLSFGGLIFSLFALFGDKGALQAFIRPPFLLVAGVFAFAIFSPTLIRFGKWPRFYKSSLALAQALEKHKVEIEKTARQNRSEARNPAQVLLENLEREGRIKESESLGDGFALTTYEFDTISTDPSLPKSISEVFRAMLHDPQTDFGKFFPRVKRLFWKDEKFYLRLFQSSEGKLLGVFSDPNYPRRYVDLAQYDFDLPVKFAENREHEEKREKSIAKRMFMRLWAGARNFEERHDSFSTGATVNFRPTTGYYSSLEWSPHYRDKRPLQEGEKKMVIPVLPTVFSPGKQMNEWMDREYQLRLIQEVHPGDDVLVLGSGSGIDTWIASFKTERPIDAGDINPMAVLNTKLTARAANISVRVEQADGLFDMAGQPLFSGKQYDLIVWNMPEYAQREEKPRTVDERWDGDRQGEILQRFLQELPRRVKPGGRVLIWNSPKNEVLKKLRRGGDTVQKNWPFTAERVGGEKSHVYLLRNNRSEARQTKTEWNEKAWEQIEKVNPGTRQKVQRILETPFSQLKADIDYDDFQGRSVLIYLQKPVRYLDPTTGSNGIISAVKVKGAVFENEPELEDFNLVLLDPRVSPADAAVLGKKLLEPVFSKEGILSFIPKRPAPEGAMRKDMALQEYVITEEAFSEGLPVPLALGFTEFENRISDGSPAAAVVLGVSSARDSRVTDLIALKTTAYQYAVSESEDETEKQDLSAFFEQDVLRLAFSHGQTLRLFNDFDFIHPQFHLGNGGVSVDFSNETVSFYLEDHEGSLSRDGMTDAEFLGWLVLGLKQAASQVDKMKDKRFYSGPQLDWTAEFIRGYFGEEALLPEFKKYLLPGNSSLFVEDLHAVLIDAESRPIYEIDSPLVRALSKMYELDFAARSEMRGEEQWAEDVFKNFFLDPVSREKFVKTHLFLRTIGEDRGMEPEDIGLWVLEWDFARALVLNQLMENLGDVQRVAPERLESSLDLESVYFQVLELAQKPQHSGILDFFRNDEELPIDFERKVDEALAAVREELSEAATPQIVFEFIWRLRQEASDYQRYLNYITGIVEKENFWKFDLELEKREWQETVFFRSEQRAAPQNRKGGTVLMSQSELAGLSDVNYEALFKFAYTQTEIKWIIFGEDDLSAEGRLKELRSIPGAKTRLDFALDENAAFQKIKQDARAVLLEAAAVSAGRILPKNISRAKTDGAPQEMALGFYLLLNGFVQGLRRDANGFLKDSSGWIMGEIQQFLNHQVFARAA